MATIEVAINDRGLKACLRTHHDRLARPIRSLEMPDQTMEVGGIGCGTTGLPLGMRCERYERLSHR